MSRNKGAFERTIDHAERDAEAARLRSRGKTYRAIASELGMSLGAVHDAVQRAIAAVPVEAVNELRQIECARLDAIIAKAWEIVDAHHPVVSNGKLFDDLDDQAPVLAALALILRTAESKRKLLGLDAPTRRIISVVTEDVVDEDMRRLDAEYEALLAEEAAAAAGDDAGPRD